MATIDGSIVLIALPDIFRGIGLDPLLPGEQLLPAVDDPRLPRRHQRARGHASGAWATSTAGCASTTSASPSSPSSRSLLSITWLTGTAGRHLADRDAHLPGRRRRHAHGQLGRHPHRRLPRRTSAASPSASTRRPPSAASFIGLILGGILAPINWRLIFLVSVPIGLFATVWGYLAAARARAAALGPHRLGRATSPSPSGWSSIMVGITYGIEPYGGHAMGWTNPVVLVELGVGRALLLVALLLHRGAHATSRCSDCSSSRSGPSPPASSPASWLRSSRGGLMFMLIIWLQGIWLPLHGYSFAVTPLWAGIAMIPLTVGLAHRRPDRRASCPTATAPGPSPPAA